MWTQFWDMLSGGGQKEQWANIYIEAPEPEAKVIFYNRFGHNPDRVTCTCCGEDYSLDESETLEQASAYHRNCAYDETGYIEKQREDLRKSVKGDWEKYLKENPSARYQTVEQYINNPDVLVIYAKDIKPEERIGEVPEQGYVWVD